jgi:hypothetical protein
MDVIPTSTLGSLLIRQSDALLARHCQLLYDSSAESGLCIDTVQGYELTF